MFWSDIEESWNEIRSRVKLQWEKLSNARLEVIIGSRDQVDDWIHRTHDVSKQAAESRVSGSQQRQRAAKAAQ